MQEFHKPSAMQSLRLVVLALLAVSSLLTGCSDGSDQPGSRNTGNYDTQLTVTDPEGLGVVGDDLLSLAEAIQLANGVLQATGLSAAEQAQVDGQPGVASRDRIVFDVDGGAVRFPLQIQEKPPFDFAVLTPISLMPRLAGNDGDAIDGDGIRFTNGDDDATDTVNNPPIFRHAPLGGIALEIASSDFSVRGVTFERFILSLSLHPAQADAGLVNVEISGNRFHNTGGLNFSATTPQGERSRLQQIAVSGNEFRGSSLFDENFPSMLHTAIFFVGATEAAAGGAGQTLAVLEDIRISGNSIEEFGTSVQLAPLQTIFTPNGGARMSRVTISDNDISVAEHAPDPAIYVWGAVNVGGQVSDVEVSDLRIENNNVTANGYAMVVLGVEVLIAGSPSTNVRIDGVRIAGNTIQSRSDCTYGIVTMGAFLELGGSTAHDVVLSNLEVADNAIRGCHTGILASPAINVGAPDISANNTIDGLVIQRNDIRDVETGILVSGGVLNAAEFGGLAGLESNVIRGLVARDNVFDTRGVDMLVAGGYATGSAQGEVTMNSVDIVDIAGNTTVQGDAPASCEIRSDANVASSATVRDNLVTGNAPSCDWAMP